MLVLISRTWVAEFQARSGPEERDFVRVEIESALARKIPVVPVLLGDAPVPSAASSQTKLGQGPYIALISSRSLDSRDPIVIAVTVVIRRAIPDDSAWTCDQAFGLETTVLSPA